MKRWKRFFRSFRLRVLLSFAALKLILLAWVITYMQIDDRQNELSQLAERLKKVEHSFVSANLGFQNFLFSGFRDSEFYTTGRAEGLDPFITEQGEQSDSLYAIIQSMRENKIDLEEKMCSEINLNMELRSSLQELKKEYLKRGYVDYGVEGDMRKAIHSIEDSGSLPIGDILQLRRHEKDFLLRYDSLYVDSFNVMVAGLFRRGDLPQETRSLLQTYQQEFNELVAIENTLGGNGNGGLYSEIRTYIDQISQNHKALNELALSEISEVNEGFKKLLWQVSLVAIILAVVLSVYFSSVLTRDIRELNQKVFAFKKSHFREIPELKEDSGSLEAQYLNRHLNKMMGELSKTLSTLETDKEKAEETSKHKTLFLANMSHEIRTPLNGITGMLHIMKSTNLTDEQLEYLEVMDYSANHLMELINMILDHSKINAGQMKAEKIEFDLDGDLKKLKKIFEHKCEEKGLEFKVNIEGDTSRNLIGDPLRLQQVLMNLINNAIKFTSRGGITLNIEELGQTEKSQTLLFKVEDTGIGIGAEKLSRLFEAFEQADSSTTREYGGTGLGLTISQALVKLMGGELKVKSEEGEGSVFYFELKLKTGNTKSKFLATTAVVEGGNEVKNKPRILLAEDNPVNQKVLSLMIGQMDIEVDLAWNGKEAVEKFSSEYYDMILMDLQMPVMDGLEAMKVIKATARYADKPIPIIAVTANAFSEDRIRALHEGMDDYLSKPVKPADFKGLLVKYLQTSGTFI